MFKVYILKSINGSRHYIGHASDMHLRLKRHNAGLVRSTKAFAPWTLIYTEYYETKAEAYRRELEIKGYKGGLKFKALLKDCKD